MSRKKVKLCIICITGVIGVILIGITLQRLSQYKSVKKNFNIEAEKLKELEADIVQLKDSIESYQEERFEFEEYLFTEQDIPSFLDGVSQFAKDTGVKIIDMKTKKFRKVNTRQSVDGGVRERVVARKQKKALKEQQLDMEDLITLAAMPINMQIQGDFKSTLSFLEYLENFKQLLSISNIELASSRDYPDLKCEFTIKIYSLKTLEEIDNLESN